MLGNEILYFRMYTTLGEGEKVVEEKAVEKVEVMVVRDRRREVIVEASESALHF